MARKTSNNGGLSDEYIEKIRVKPEDTAKRLASLPYTITPKPNEKPLRGTLWCCYEAKWTKFIESHPLHPHSSYSRCESCGISIEDFYVKTENGLWSDKKER